MRIETYKSCILADFKISSAFIALNQRKVCEDCCICLVTRQKTKTLQQQKLIDKTNKPSATLKSFPMV